MKACNRCATVATGPSMKCRQCGALLVAPPVAPPAGSPQLAPGTAAVSTAVAPAAEERFFAPATFTPVVVAPPARPTEKRRGPLVAIVVVVVVLACGTAAFATIHHGDGSGASSAGGSKAPVTLPPIGASGLPSIADAVRVQAEAGRQHAFVVAAQASTESDGAPLSVETLRNIDPSLVWVTAAQSSTGPSVVSFSQSGETVIVAVATKSGDVCALGRWSPAGVGEYVTLGNVSSCRAADAPGDGWTELSPVGGGSRLAPPEGY